MHHNERVPPATSDPKDPLTSVAARPLCPSNQPKGRHLSTANHEPLPANVGVASRLVSQEPIPWSQETLRNDLLAPQISPGVSRLPNELGFHSMMQRFGSPSYSCREPAFLTNNFQHATGLNGALMNFYCAQQTPPFQVINPSSMTVHTSSPVAFSSYRQGFAFSPEMSRVGAESSLHFQYPLHHITGSSMIPAGISSPYSSGPQHEFVALNHMPYYPQIERYSIPASLATNQTGFRHPNSPLILPTLPQQPSISYPSPVHSPAKTTATPTSAHHNDRVLPAFVFDDPDGSRPEDLSLRTIADPLHSSMEQKQRNQAEASALPYFEVFTGNDQMRETAAPKEKRPELSRPCDIISVLEEALRRIPVKSEMSVASAEWAANRTSDDDDCWNFMQNFKKRKQVRDWGFVQIRSLLAQARSNVTLPNLLLERIPEHILQLFDLTPEYQNVQNDFTDDEDPVDAADVDTYELRKFCGRLTGGIYESLSFPTGSLSAEILRSVGLSEDDAFLRGKPALLPSDGNIGKKRKRRKETRDAKRARSVAAARNLLKSRLKTNVQSLKFQVTQLKRKTTAIKLLMKKESTCLDDDIAEINSELDVILLH